jgi:hypothetical protein
VAGPNIRSGGFGEAKNLLLLNIEPQCAGHPSLSVVTISTTRSCLHRIITIMIRIDYKSQRVSGKTAVVSGCVFRAVMTETSIDVTEHVRSMNEPTLAKLLCNIIGPVFLEVLK